MLKRVWPSRTRIWVPLLILTLGFCGCVAAPAVESVAPDEALLRVGVTADAPPLIFKRGKAYLGLEAELAEKLGQFLHKKIAFIEVPWEDQVQALLDDRTDIIMSGMSITPLREVLIAFSTPYFRTGQMALIRIKHKKIAPYGFYGIKGVAITLRFGVVAGTTGEYFVHQNFSRTKKIIAFTHANEATEALLGDNIDILIHDAPMVLMLAAQNEANGLTVVPSLLTEEYLAWGLRKSDPEMLAAVNRFVNQTAANGTMDEIIQRWIPLVH